MSKDTSELFELFTEVLGATAPIRSKRLVSALHAPETNYLVMQGLRFARQAPDWWKLSINSRLLDEQDELEPILGEIRAFGVLCSAGLQVSPIPTAKVKGITTPDFEVTARDGSILKVDVATKGWDTAQKEAAERFFAAGEDAPLKPGIHFRTLESMPFGAPAYDPVSGSIKKGDSTTANAIQRLCAIKQDEEQFAQGEMNLIYIDLARGDPLALVGIDSVFPLRSFNNCLTSGELFAAFYGKKEMPVYNNRPLDYSALGMTVMGHNGRFRLGSKLSGVMISCRDGFALLENPWAQNSLTEGVRWQLLGCFGAQLEHFYAGFQGNEALIAKIDANIGLLEHFQNIDSD